ncbi:MAG: hypothetical protein JWP26_1854 [Devosia sp.]|uniref:hypothetical protein n=1 Tax=Devosia sp. TaxID=1871048 RepID=UPI0026216968|nr:hypothetical protein [Devosia sp.]MDB5586884.1 hypothetical protein [Devosia sp.]
MANRNRKKMSAATFKKLVDHAAAYGTDIANADKVRWIKRLRDEDAELMSKADVIDRRKITRQMRAVLFEHEDRRFVAFFGFASVDDMPNGLPEGLTEIELTPGTFGISVTETEVMPRATAAEIRELIESEFEGVENYEGHELQAIRDLFPRILIVEASVDFTYTSDIDRVLGAMVAATYIDGPIALSEATLNAASELFSSGSEYIPYQNVLQGVLSIYWGGFFVDLYRCVEQLYAVPRLLDLTKDWSSSRSIAELADLLDKRLAWRPREEEALIRVIGGCPLATAKKLISAFGGKLEETSIPADIAARHVYNMRNGLVHFRGDTKIAQPTDDQWDQIILAMIGLVSETYAAFGKQYHVATAIAAPAMPVPAAPAAEPA